MRFNGRRWWMGLGLVLLGMFGSMTDVRAQVVPVDSYELRYYAPGAAAPTQTETFPGAAAVCDLPEPTGTVTVNPTRAYFSDINRAGRWCMISFAQNGVVASSPVGNYEATIVLTNAGGASGESPRAPFSRLAVPPAPVELRFGR